MDHEILARELLRALRGKRSQPLLSRRIGLRSNLVHRWERGRAWPSAPQFFRIARVGGVRVGDGLQRLLGRSSAVSTLELEQSEGTSALLRVLAGARSVKEIAERVGKSRFVVSRWLSGATEIRLTSASSPNGPSTGPTSP